MDFGLAKYSIAELRREKYDSSFDRCFAGMAFTCYVQNDEGRWYVDVSFSAKRRYISIINNNQDDDVVELKFSNRSFNPSDNKYRGIITVDLFSFEIDDNWDYNLFLYLMIEADKRLLNGKVDSIVPLDCVPYIPHNIPSKEKMICNIRSVRLRNYDEYNDSDYFVKTAQLDIFVYDANTEQPAPIYKFSADSENCWIKFSSPDAFFVSDRTGDAFRREPYSWSVFKQCNPCLYCNPSCNTIYLLDNPEKFGGFAIECPNPEQYYLLGDWLNGVLFCEEKSDTQLQNSVVCDSRENSAIQELERLIGLNEIKLDVKELINFAKIQKSRRDRGMKAVPVSLHLVFTGNPGTGKTSVARILAKLYKEIGILASGQLVEVDRSDLVAGYVGQTAIKTQDKIKEAMGGVLFIDEAYTLAKEGNDFGQEAIDTLLKAMEDNRDQFIVIVAGYSAPMEKFINSNPGLKSRFNKYIFFPDYSSGELFEIFLSMCKEFDYIVEAEVEQRLQIYFDSMVQNKNENFANARDVRNLFEDIITNQASRIASINNITDDDMMTISLEDIECIMS